MKKVISTILGLACIAGFILAGAQCPDGSCDIAWSVGCLSISVLCGLLFAKLNPEKKEA